MGCECPNIIKQYLPEFTKESTGILFIVKIVLIGTIALLLTIFEVYADTRIFDTGSAVTWQTLSLVVIFNIVVGFLILIYVPYQWHIVPFWYALTISIIYLGLMVFFTLNGLVWDNIVNVDTPAFDGWTSVHTMAGVWLGLVMPFVPFCFIISIWEVLEAEWTTGLGDGESVSNHVVDVLVAVVGWFFTVLLGMYVFGNIKIFPWEQSTINWLGARDKEQEQCLIKWIQPFYRIPWISSRAASCKKCYWEIDWSNPLQATEGQHEMSTV